MMVFTRLLQSAAKEKQRRKEIPPSSPRWTQRESKEQEKETRLLLESGREFWFLQSRRYSVSWYAFTPTVNLSYPK